MGGLKNFYMEQVLRLTKTTAFTVYSADDIMRSSNKGLYLDANIASVKAEKSGWYGSDGTVQTIEVYKDEDGVFYSLKVLGKPTDVEEKYKADTLNSIKLKLTKEELELIGVK